MARLIVDMDDTLCELNHWWIGEYNLLSGDHLTRDQIKSWDIDNYVLPSWRAPKGRPYTEGQFFGLLFRPGFFNDILPCEGAIETCQMLQERGHEIVIATAVVDNHPEIIKGKQYWMSKYMPFVPKDNLVFIQRKGLLKGDVIVDDSAKQVSSFGGAKILVDRPWNREIDWTPDVRMTHWNQVAEYLGEAA